MFSLNGYKSGYPLTQDNILDLLDFHKRTSVYYQTIYKYVLSIIQYRVLMRWFCDRKQTKENMNILVNIRPKGEWVYDD